MELVRISRTQDGQLRQNQFNALFRLTRTTRHTCTACLHSRVEDSDESIGMTITPLEEGGETVSAAIARMLRYVSSGTMCSQCSVPRTHAVHFTLDATPEYLRVSVRLEHAQPVLDESGNEMLEAIGEPLGVSGTSGNGIVVDDVLSLTDYMTHQDGTPVEYKLHCATYHQSNGIDAGHYTAGVTQPRGPGRRSATAATQFFIDDDQVIDWRGTPEKPNALTENPVGTGIQKPNVVVLWYEMIPHEPKIETMSRGVRQSANQRTIKEGEAIVVAMHRREMAKGIQSRSRCNSEVELHTPR